MKKLLLCLLVIPMVLQSCYSNGSQKAESSPEDSLSKQKPRAFVSRKDSAGLLIFTPTYTTMDLVCGKRPGVEDSSVVYCAEAAFTGECLDSFQHRNVAGNHVVNGVYHRGYAARTNTGAFVWYRGKWKFLYDNYAGELRAAADNGGMGFGQNMVIYNGKILPLFRKDKPMNIYRVLCELNGKLCVVEAKRELPYSEFVAMLEKLQVRNALYLDMGSGWNYSWYRDSVGNLREIHPQKPWSKYQTNWIVFK